MGSPAKKLTVTQERVADVLASGRAATVVEAAELAKVNPSTVHRLRNSATGQHEIALRLARKSDTARDLKSLSSKKLASRLSDDSASDQLLLGTYKVANEVLASGVEEEEAVDHSSLYRQLKLWLRYSRRYGCEAALASCTTRYGS